MLTKIKQIMCRHDYQVVGYDHNVFHAMFVCSKCSKRKDVFY